MNSKSPLNRKVQFAFGSAIVILLVVGAIAYWGMVESGESDRWVRHTHEVLESLQALRSAGIGMEASYRGFVLTGQESYVESYRASQLIAQQEVATIGGLTLDNRLQQGRLPDLARLTAAQIQFAEMVINLRRAKELEAAGDVIRSGAGQPVTDEFQTLVGKMQDEELRLLALR